MSHVKKLWLGFCLLLAVSFITTLINSPQVSAGTLSEYGVTDQNKIQDSIQSLEWVDAGHIKLTFKTGQVLVFLPGGVSDNGGTNLQDERLSSESGYGITYNKLQDNTFGCPAKIEFDIDETRSAFSKQSLQLTAGHVDLDFRKNADSDCSDGNEFNMDIAKPELSIAYFKWIDPNKIGMVDGDTPGNFTRGTTTAEVDGVIYDVFLSDKEAGDSKCRNKLLLNNANNTIRWYDLSESADGNPPDSVSTTCSYNDEDDFESWPRNNYVWALANTAASVATVPPTAPGSTEPGAGGGSEDNTCESKSGAMGWILCPIVNLIDGALNWVDTQVQGLLEIDQNKYTNPTLENAWRSIRNIAYIILIPIMLVMVIGTALGFEAFSAYTVKKALPRMVVAVIFITFSWEICTFLITFFNVVGGGILGLITSPFRQQITDLSCQNGNLNLSCLFSVEPGINGSSVIHSILFLPTAAASIIGLIVFLIFFGATLLIAVGAAFLILLARQMFIIALLLVSPLAILAWIFPGNDALWKGWWGTFSKLLLMFPLIMLIIGVGRIFALLLNITGGGGLDGSVLNPIMKLGAYMLPYAFIPFTFKFAGGLFGNLAGIVNDKNKGLFDRAKKSRHQKWNRKGAPYVTKKRVAAARNLSSRASKSGVIGRTAFGTLGRRVGGYNIEAQASAMQASVGKELNDQIATGRDDAIRGLTVNKKAAMAAGSLVDDGKGTRSNGLMKETYDKTTGKTTGRQYKSLAGQWVDEAYVDEGHKRWGNNTFAQQTALSYEMRKAMKDEDVQAVSDRYIATAKDQWGMSDTEAQGAWIGAGFENQNQHLEYKNTSLTMGSDRTKWAANLNASKFADEVFEKKGSYPLAQMSAHTIKQLGKAYDTGDADTKQKIASIAETFMYRGGANGGMTLDANGNPIPQQQQAGTQAVPGSIVQTNSPGAAHVNQAVRDLAVKTGVYRADLSTPRTTSDRPNVDPYTGNPVGPANPDDPTMPLQN